MSIEAATVEAFGVPMPETEHPPTDIENTQASSTSIAPAPFNNVDLDADLIFRTSDNVDFYVHKLILKKASSFFADMLTLAQDATCSSVDVSDELPESSSGRVVLPIVPVAEASPVFNGLLRIFYPVCDVKRTSLTEVVDTLTVALKYGIEKAVERTREELLAYVPSTPLAVYVAACNLDCEHEAHTAVKSWLPTNVNQWSSSSNIGRRAYEMCNDLQRTTAGHLYRLVRFGKGDNTTLCSPPPLYSSSPDDQVLTLDELHTQYPFTAFPNPDIIVRSVDDVDIPAHIAHLFHAGAASTILELPKESHPDSGCPMLCLEEDGRTLAALLQLCYPFGEQELTRNGCSVSIVARARKTAEKYGMVKVAEVAEYLMAEQMNKYPVQVYFAASRHGWKTDAEFAATQCLALADIGGADTYTKEMEVVSAEVYYNLFKTFEETRYKPAPSSSVGYKKRNGRR